MPAVALGGGGASAATTPCSVGYQVNQWSGGFTAEVSVTDGGAALTAWTVSWTFDAGQQITSAWNAQVKQAGQAVSASNESYNGSVASGGTLDFGFQGTWSGTDDTPANFALDGVSCEGGATTSASATASGSTSASASASISASASSSASGSGSPSASASSPAGGSGCTATGVVFCDGFENQAGSVPSGRWSVYELDCSGTGTASIDSTTAHTGGKSAKVVGVDGYCNHVLIRDAADMGLAGPVWDVRFWVMHTAPLPTGHVTFVAMNDANAGGTDLRFGGQDGALMWNRQSDDQTLPDQSPAGVAQSAALPVGTWNCVELQVNGSTGAITSWLDGTRIAGLSENGTPVADVSDQWLAGSGASWRPSLTDLKFGWESYGGGGNDTLWFDDIALSTGRIGC
ncbi:MAG TPA: cellulose-binding domain-containing protein [Actinospica sp.]|nr:cellulose-binding domain-containing protein [Actinospica sp.]